MGGLSFGTDGDGNYGYYGADGSLIPFKSVVDSLISIDNTLSWSWTSTRWNETSTNVVNGLQFDRTTNHVKITNTSSDTHIIFYWAYINATIYNSKIDDDYTIKPILAVSLDKRYILIYSKINPNEYVNVTLAGTSYSAWGMYGYIL